jgi:predicted transcriptional regulator
MRTKPTATVIPLKPSQQPRPKRRADQRWGKAVIDRGFTVIPTMLFWAQARLRLTADEFNVVLQLVAHWWDANEDPRPAKDTIAERMDKNPWTIQPYITGLEQKGLVKRIPRYRPGRGQGANAYSLEGLVKQLKDLEPEFRKVIEQNRIRRRRVERPTASRDA